MLTDNVRIACQRECLHDPLLSTQLIAERTQPVHLIVGRSCLRIMEECNSQTHSETDIPIACRSRRECAACIYITSSAARFAHAHAAFKKLWDNWCTLALSRNTCEKDRRRRDAASLAISSLNAYR